MTGVDLYWYKAQVIRLRDGDTLIATLDQGCRVFTTRVIRLAGVAAPELRAPGGPEAAAWLQASVDICSGLLWCRTLLDADDPYGRLLAWIYDVPPFNPSPVATRTRPPAPGSLNEEMIAAGHAEVYRR